MWYVFKPASVCLRCEPGEAKLHFDSSCSSVDVSKARNKANTNLMVHHAACSSSRVTAVAAESLSLLCASSRTSTACNQLQPIL